MQSGRRLDHNPSLISEAVVGKCLLDGDERLAMANYLIASREHNLASKDAKSLAMLLPGRQKCGACYISPRFDAVFFQDNSYGNIGLGKVIFKAGIEPF